MKILLAEDDIVARMFLTNSLRKSGHEVVAAHDGEEAWAALISQSLRIIVSD